MPIEPLSVNVELIRDAARLPALAEAWDELIDEREPGSVFRSSAWLVPWWRWFSGGRELCVYAATAGKRLVGVLPAYREKSLGVERLRLLGDGVVTSDYLGVIARPDELETASEAIAHAIRENECQILFDGVSASEPLARELQRTGRTKSWSFVLERQVCPYVEIDPVRGFDAWLREQPRGSHLRRRRRWLESRPGFRVEIVTDAAKVSQVLPTLWQLHRARWTSAGGTSAITGSHVEQFHHETARALARRGWIRLYLLSAEGAPRAALYGFERGGRFFYYQSGSDPAWSARSVGTVVLGAALEDAFARHLREFDLLRGNEPYKTLYAASHRGLVTVRAAAGIRARSLLLAHQAGLGGIRVTEKLVGAGVTNRIRTAARSRPIRGRRG